MSQSVEIDAIAWEMIRERDDYRARCQAAVERIEREAGKTIDHQGNVVYVVLPVESWRSIRAMLQREPRVTPPGKGRPTISHAEEPDHPVYRDHPPEETNRQGERDE